jgi:predicted AAA+ superfamily ATPase
MEEENGDILLSPAQQKAFEALRDGIDACNIVVFKCRPCCGRTTILRQIRGAMGGVMLGMQEFMQSLAQGDPSALEESFVRMVEGALTTSDLVLLDDLHLVTQVVQSCDYQRCYLLDAALTALIARSELLQKKLVVGTDDEVPPPLLRRGFSCQLSEFETVDYRTICDNLLPGRSDELDYRRIHSFAPALNAQQLRNACGWLSRHGAVTSDSFIEYLRSHDMTSNVELDEVQRVTWSDLKGVDEVICELEAKVALPFEQDAVRQELGLKPKRGVLLAGPPGTGKTTIGRALAHRLKSKFFLIDGTVVAGSGDFYRKVDAVFDAARRNAPAIVFIDDADVIFENADNRGFYRYLLTILDGLESAATERICVMMTAMHPANIPAAMLRSGRVELWLETRLPDVEARSAILRDRLAGLPDPLGTADVEKIASASHGLTGADLKNVVDDAKLLFASDKIQQNPLPPIGDYFLRAIRTVRANRRRYLRPRPSNSGETGKFGFSIN